MWRPVRSEAREAARIPHDDQLRTTVTTRAAAKALGHILRYLSAPLSGALLAHVDCVRTVVRKDNHSFVIEIDKADMTRAAG